MTIHDKDFIVSLCANDVFRRFHGYVDRSELVSEGWLWIQEHQAQVQAYEEDAKVDPKRAMYRIRRDITMSMEIFARSEKASQLGYSPNDEYFYTEAMLNLILPHVVYEDPDPPSRESEGPRTVNDPAEGNNWAAFYLDMKNAWENAGLGPEERVTLLMRHVEKVKSYTEVGDQLGLTYAQARKLHRQAVQRVMTFLGGLRPVQECPHDCQCHRSPLRTRPGVRSRLAGADQFLD